MSTDITKMASTSLTHERLKTLGMIASGIAHELNGPLTTIRACSQGLLNRLQKDKIDRVLFKEYLEIVAEEILRCMYITDNILRFIKDEKGSCDQSVDIHASLDKAIDMVKMQGRCQEITIVRNYVRTAPTVLGNECELRQTFSSIIVNALDVMKTGDTLTLETLYDKDSVHISFKNDGDPISSENLTRIFDPYFTTKANQGGTGLGLFLACSIIKEQGGDIKVASNEAEGTTFTIILPCYLEVQHLP